MAWNGSMRMKANWLRIWKEAVVAFVKELSQNLCGGTEKNHEEPQLRRFV